MPDLDADTLARLAPLRRQLRDIKCLTESRPGTFSYGGTALVQFSEAEGKVIAELRNAMSGSAAVVRYAVDDAVEARKLVDEAKRRIAKLTDD